MKHQIGKLLVWLAGKIDSNISRIVVFDNEWTFYEDNELFSAMKN